MTTARAGLIGGSRGVQFFVDESFQQVAGRRVGALGCMAIPTGNYNRFCGAVFSIKREILGVENLSERELKGSNCFSRSLFRLRNSGTEPDYFKVMDQILTALARNGAIVFARWTDQPELLSLRNTRQDELTIPYQQLIRDFAYAQRIHGGGPRGAINLDQLGFKEDLHAACTIQNYIARSDTHSYLQSKLLQIPNYTHSAVSPGLQMADLIAFLAAQQTAPEERPELAEWWDQFAALSIDPPGTSRSGGKLRPSIGSFTSSPPSSASEVGPATPEGV
jgi:hypothetical protein